MSQNTKAEKVRVGKESRWKCMHCGDVVNQVTPGLPFRDPECSNKYGHDYV